MTKTYSEIISVVRGDIERLEAEIVKDLRFPTGSLNELLLAPAKRIRSALAFLFLRARGIEPTDEHFAVQTAVELAHSASLIHDDIIDYSKKRRGLETLNEQFGDKIGVLTGDYILSVALRKIIDKPTILKEFLETFSQMAQGEINQHFSKFEIPTLEEYIEKTVQKTAGLFRLALLETAPEFGWNFGIAFQINNDLKDLEEDIKNGVYTAPVIFSGDAQNVTDTAISKTVDLINYYLLAAEQSLNNLPQNEFLQGLKEILELYKDDRNVKKIF